MIGHNLRQRMNAASPKKRPGRRIFILKSYSCTKNNFREKRWGDRGCEGSEPVCARNTAVM
jgi:hypothetical protein